MLDEAAFGEFGDAIDELCFGDCGEFIGESVGAEPLQQPGDVERVATDFAGVALATDAFADAELDGDQRRRTRNVDRRGNRRTFVTWPNDEIDRHPGVESKPVRSVRQVLGIAFADVDHVEFHVGAQQHAVTVPIETIGNERIEEPGLVVGHRVDIVRGSMCLAQPRDHGEPSNQRERRNSRRDFGQASDCSVGDAVRFSNEDDGLTRHG